MASYLHRTAQPFTLAIFRSWGSSTGAGRIRLADAKIGENVYCQPPKSPKGGLLLCFILDTVVRKISGNNE